VDLALFGTPPDSFLAPDAQARDALAGTPGLVLSEELATSAGLAVGDELTVVGPETTLPILGFTYGGSYGHVDIGFVSLEVWQQLVYGSEARGRFSAIAVRADDPATIADLPTVDAAAGTATETREAAYAGSPGYAAETATMSLISGFLLVISALVVAAFFTVWTVQRTRQIGLLKALGATNAYVLRDALGQLAVVLVVATAVGAAVAIGLGQLVGAGVPFSLEPLPIVTSTATLVVLGLVGSTVAIRRITTVDPAIALGGADA
jgi:putative ABC transport system permease protein